LSDSNDGNKEPFFDFRLFREQKKLKVFLYNMAQRDNEKIENIGPQMVYVLELVPELLLKD
jgi:hypothetical protein